MITGGKRPAQGRRATGEQGSGFHPGVASVVPVGFLSGRGAKAEPSQPAGGARLSLAEPGHLTAQSRLLPSDCLNVPHPVTGDYSQFQLLFLSPLPHPLVTF